MELHKDIENGHSKTKVILYEIKRKLVDGYMLRVYTKYRKKIN